MPLAIRCSGNASGRSRCSTPQALDLAEVVTAVNPMKLAPFGATQRADDRMIEKTSVSAVGASGALDDHVHFGEPDENFGAHLRGRQAFRSCVTRRLAAFGQISAANDDHGIEKKLGTHVDALIGLDVLGQSSFRIDYEQQQLVFGAVGVLQASAPLKQIDRMRTFRRSRRWSRARRRKLSWNTSASRRMWFNYFGVGLSLPISRTIFQVPSFCLFQIVAYLP